MEAGNKQMAKRNVLVPFSEKNIAIKLEQI